MMGQVEFNLEENAMSLSPLERYLRALRATHNTGGGVAESSFYPALVALLNEVGATLSPPVRCLSILRNLGAGHPDGGLYSAEQWVGKEEPEPNQLPARGVIEVKGVSADVAQVAASAQVARYLDRYGLVLVTSYRAFLLVGRDERGALYEVEQYEIAPDEATFWQAAQQAEQTANTQDARLVEFLQRVMRHAAPLRTPADIAWFLASYAREALARLEGRELRALSELRAALEQALAHLGEHTLDIYLNEVAYWRNVPTRVWEYTLGGYPVIKKWLSYREEKLLERPLSVSEVREVSEMARRIAALLLMEAALDATYARARR